MKLVVNEWLLEDLEGRNGPHKRAESSRFLGRLQRSEDRIVVMTPTEWTRKAYKLMRATDVTSRTLSKQLHALLRDPIRCELISDGACEPLDSQLREATPPSDHYLIRTHLSANADRTITTDTKLIERLQPFTHVRLELRDGFLRSYIDR